MKEQTFLIVRWERFQHKAMYRTKASRTWLAIKILLAEESLVVVQKESFFFRFFNVASN